MPTTDDFQPFDEWTAARGGAKSAADLHAYGDYAKTKYFLSGDDSPETRQQVDAGVLAKAAQLGFVKADPEEGVSEDDAHQFFYNRGGANDTDYDKLTDFYLANGESERADKVIGLRTALDTTLASHTPEQAEQAKADATFDVGVSAFKRMREDAVRSGQSPIASYVDEQGVVQVDASPEVRGLSREGLVQLAANNKSFFDPEHLPELLRLTTPDEHNMTPAERRRRTEIASAAADLVKEDPEYRRNLEESMSAYSWADQSLASRVAKSATTLPLIAFEALRDMKDMVVGNEAQESMLHVPIAKKFRETLEDSGLAEHYSSEELDDFADDMIQTSTVGSALFDKDDPAKSIRTLSDGKLIAPSNLMLHAEAFEKALNETDAPASSKQRLRAERAANIGAIAQQAIPALLEADPAGFADFYEQHVAAGTSPEKIVEQFITENDFSEGFWGANFRESVAMTLLQVGTDIGTFVTSKVPVLGDVMHSASEKVALEAASNRQLASIMGDTVYDGVGGNLALAVPPLVADIALTKGVAKGAAAAKASKFATGLKTAGRAKAAGYAYSAARIIPPAAADAVAKFNKGLLGTSSLTEAAGTIARASVSGLAKVAPVGDELALFTEQYARQWGNAYTQTHSALATRTDETGQPLYTPAELKEAASDVASRSAMFNASTTFVVGRMLGQGAEALALTRKGVTRAEMRGIYDDAIAGVRKLPKEFGDISKVSFAEFERDTVKAIARLAYGTSSIAKGGASEAVEEIIQTTGELYFDAAAADEKIEFTDLANATGMAATLGFALGGGADLTIRGVSKANEAISEKWFGPDPEAKTKARAQAASQVASTLDEAGLSIAAEYARGIGNDAIAKGKKFAEHFATFRSENEQYQAAVKKQEDDLAASIAADQEAADDTAQRLGSALPATEQARRVLGLPYRAPAAEGRLQGTVQRMVNSGRIPADRREIFEAVAARAELDEDAVTRPGMTPEESQEQDVIDAFDKYMRESNKLGKDAPSPTFLDSESPETARPEARKPEFWTAKGLTESEARAAAAKASKDYAAILALRKKSFAALKDMLFADPRIEPSLREAAKLKEEQEAPEKELAAAKKRHADEAPPAAAPAVIIPPAPEATPENLAELKSEMETLEATLAKPARGRTKKAKAARAAQEARLDVVKAHFETLRNTTFENPSAEVAKASQIKAQIAETRNQLSVGAEPGQLADPDYTPVEFRGVQTTRGELREYRNEMRVQLADAREELKGATDENRDELKGKRDEAQASLIASHNKLHEISTPIEGSKKTVEQLREEIRSIRSEEEADRQRVTLEQQEIRGKGITGRVPTDEEIEAALQEDEEFKANIAKIKEIEKTIADSVGPIPTVSMLEATLEQLEGILPDAEYRAELAALAEPTESFATEYSDPLALDDFSPGDASTYIVVVPRGNYFLTDSDLLREMHDVWTAANRAETIPERNEFVQQLVELVERAENSDSRLELGIAGLTDTSTSLPLFIPDASGDVRTPLQRMDDDYTAALQVRMDSLPEHHKLSTTAASRVRTISASYRVALRSLLSAYDNALRSGGADESTLLDAVTQTTLAVVRDSDQAQYRKTAVSQMLVSAVLTSKASGRPLVDTAVEQLDIAFEVARNRAQWSSEAEGDAKTKEFYVTEDGTLIGFASVADEIAVQDAIENDGHWSDELESSLSFQNTGYVAAVREYVDMMVKTLYPTFAAPDTVVDKDGMISRSVSTVAQHHLTPDATTKVGVVFFRPSEAEMELNGADAAKEVRRLSNTLKQLRSIPDDQVEASLGRSYWRLVQHARPAARQKLRDSRETFRKEFVTAVDKAAPKDRAKIRGEWKSRWGNSLRKLIAEETAATINSIQLAITPGKKILLTKLPQNAVEFLKAARLEAYNDAFVVTEHTPEGKSGQAFGHFDNTPRTALVLRAANIPIPIPAGFVESGQLNPALIPSPDGLFVEGVRTPLGRVVTSSADVELAIVDTEYQPRILKDRKGESSNGQMFEQIARKLPGYTEEDLEQMFGVLPKSARTNGKATLQGYVTHFAARLQLDTSLHPTTRNGNQIEVISGDKLAQWINVTTASIQQNMMELLIAKHIAIKGTEQSETSGAALTFPETQPLNNAALNEVMERFTENGKEGISPAEFVGRTPAGQVIQDLRADYLRRALDIGPDGMSKKARTFENPHFQWVFRQVLSSKFIRSRAGGEVTVKDVLNVYANRLVLTISGAPAPTASLPQDGAATSTVSFKTLAYTQRNASRAGVVGIPLGEGHIRFSNLEYFAKSSGRNVTNRNRKGMDEPVIQTTSYEELIDKVGQDIASPNLSDYSMPDPDDAGVDTEVAADSAVAVAPAEFGEASPADAAALKSEQELEAKYDVGGPEGDPNADDFEAMIKYGPKAHPLIVAFREMSDSRAWREVLNSKLRSSTGDPSMQSAEQRNQVFQAIRSTADAAGVDTNGLSDDALIRMFAQEFFIAPIRGKKGLDTWAGLAEDFFNKILEESPENHRKSTKLMRDVLSSKIDHAKRVAAKNPDAADKVALAEAALQRFDDLRKLLSPLRDALLDAEQRAKVKKAEANPRPGTLFNYAGHTPATLSREIRELRQQLGRPTASWLAEHADYIPAHLEPILGDPRVGAALQAFEAAEAEPESESGIENPVLPADFDISPKQDAPTELAYDETTTFEVDGSERSVRVKTLGLNYFTFEVGGLADDTQYTPMDLAPIMGSPEALAQFAKAVEAAHRADPSRSFVIGEQSIKGTVLVRGLLEKAGLNVSEDTATFGAEGQAAPDLGGSPTSFSLMGSLVPFSLNDVKHTTATPLWSRVEQASSPAVAAMWRPKITVLSKKLQDALAARDILISIYVEEHTRKEEVAADPVAEIEQAAEVAEPTAIGAVREEGLRNPSLDKELAVGEEMLRWRRRGGWEVLGQEIAAVEKELEAYADDSKHLSAVKKRINEAPTPQHRVKEEMFLEELMEVRRDRDNARARLKRMQYEHLLIRYQGDGATAQQRVRLNDRVYLLRQVRAQRGGKSFDPITGGEFTGRATPEAIDKFLRDLNTVLENGGDASVLLDADPNAAGSDSYRDGLEFIAMKPERVTKVREQVGALAANAKASAARDTAVPNLINVMPVKGEVGDPKANRAELKALGHVPGKSLDIEKALYQISQKGGLEGRAARMLLKRPDLLNKVNIRFVNLPATMWAGAADPESNTLYVNLARKNPLGVSNTLLHELTHLAAANVVRNPRDARDRKLVRRLDSLRREVQDEITHNTVPAEYARVLGPAVENIDEFIAYLSTDPAAQEALAKVAPKRNLLQKFFDWLASVFTGAPNFETERAFEYAQSLIGRTGGYAQPLRPPSGIPGPEFSGPGYRGGHRASGEPILAVIKRIAPSAMTVEQVDATPTGKPLALSPGSISTLLVDVAALEKKYSDLSGPNRMAAIAAQVEQMATLSAVISGVPEAELESIGATPEAQAFAQDDYGPRTTGANYLRVRLEQAYDGRLSEGTISYFEGNPNILSRITDGIIRSISRLAHRIKGPKDGELAATLQRLHSAHHNIKARAEVPLIRKSSTVDDAAEDVGQTDRTVYHDAVALSAAWGDDYTLGGKLAKLFRVGGRIPRPIAHLVEQRSQAHTTAMHKAKRMQQKFADMRKRGVVTEGDLSLIHRALGTTEGLVTRDQQQEIELVLKEQRKEFIAQRVEETPDTGKKRNDSKAAKTARVEKGVALTDYEAALDVQRTEMIRAARLQNIAAHKEAMNAALNQLPAEVVAMIVDFRAEVRKLSGGLSSAEGFAGNFGMMIDDNSEVYLTRSYYGFSTEGWWKAVGDGAEITLANGKVVQFDRIKNNAINGFMDVARRALVREYRQSVPGVKISREDAEAVVAEEVGLRAQEMFNEFVSKMSKTTGGMLAAWSMDSDVAKVLFGPKAEGQASTSDVRFRKTVTEEFEKLTAKQDMPEWVREVLGEVTDPLETMMHTFGTVARISADVEMQSKMREQGRGKYLWSASDFPGGNIPTEMKALKLDTGPLAGFVTTEEMLEALNEVFNTDVGKETPTKALQFAQKVTGLSMMSKTLLGLGFYPRNHFGNTLFFGPMQGWWTAGKATHGKEEWGLAKLLVNFKEGTPDQQSRLNKLLDLGIIGDDIHAGLWNELMDIAGSDPDQFLSALSDIDATGDFSALPKQFGRLLMKVPNAGAALSKMIDAVYKIGLYDMERKVLDEAYGDTWTSEMKDQEAAQKVKNVSQSHSQVFPVVNSFTRSTVGVLFSPFLRFRAEVFRIVPNTIALASKEMASDNAVIRKRGTRRISGLMFTVGAMPTLLGSIITTAFALLFGDDEDEPFKDGAMSLYNQFRHPIDYWKKRHVLAEALPGYMRHHDVIITQSGGKLRVVDLSYMNPTSVITDAPTSAIRALIAGDVGGAGDAIEWGLFKEAAAQQILAHGITQAVTNKDDFGNAIAGPQNNPLMQFAKRATHALEASFMPSAKRPLTNIVTGQGGTNEAGSWQNRAQLLLGEGIGVRPRVYEVAETMQRAATGLKRELSEAREELRSVVYRPGSTPEDLRAALELAQEHQDGIFAKFRDVGEEFGKMGLSDTDWFKSGSKAGFSKNRMNLAIKKGLGERILIPDKEGVARAGETAGTSEELVRIIEEWEAEGRWRLLPGA